MRKQANRVWFFGLLLSLFWLSKTSAYDQVEIRNGGTITGKVILNGPIPEPRVFPMGIYPFGDFRKKISDGKGHILLKEFNVAGGGLQNAVVSVQNVREGKAFRFSENNLVTVNCMFHPADVPEAEQFNQRGGELVHIHPLVSVMRNRHILSVVNRDPVIHDTQVCQPETGHRVVRFPVPVSNSTIRGWIDIDQGRRIARIICGMHEYMQT